jgi:hypothetical protein
MSKQSLVARHGSFQGQILLERALFCVGCEIIFSGTHRCPRCASGETVWPLSEWVRSIQSSTVAAPPPHPAVDVALPLCRQQKRPAALKLVSEG